MATNVILPALGMAQDTGKIMEWLKAEGEQVTKGEPLVVIETDKAVVDLEAPASGTLAQVSAVAGAVVPVAQVIAVILSPEEVMRAGSTPLQPVSAAAPVPVDAAVPARPSTFRESPSTGTSLAVADARNGRRAASPKARRIATERGLDIATIPGSGPGGVVLSADVLAAPLTSRATERAAVSSPVEDTPLEAAGVALAGQPAATGTTSKDTGDSGISTIWRLMAERTTQSWATIPHFFLIREVNAARLIAWRERAARQTAEEVTYTDLLVRVVAEALRQHPRLNASWDNGSIAAHAEINIGLAVATDDGLIVPVIHRADDLSLRGIARQRADLVRRAQAGQLRLGDLQAGTFTISNLGMYGIDTFTAIISAPQAAILAVGRIVDRVVPVGGHPSVQPMMTLSLSCDHRIVDGARGAQFLARVAQLAEDPSELDR